MTDRVGMPRAVGAISYAMIVGSALGPQPASADLGPAEHQAILVGTLTAGSSLGAVAGEPPSPSHPRGTLLIAWSLQGLGATLTEWDLARARIVRQASLDGAEGSVSVARVGSWLDVAVEGLTPQGRRVSWALVDPSTLRVVRKVDLGIGASADVASDGALAVVVWNASSSVRGSEGDSWSAAVLDVDGRVLGLWRASTTHSSGARARVAVLDGRAFVAVPGQAPCLLVALAPDGSVSRQVSLASGACGSLVVHDAHLLVGADRHVEVFSSELDRIARQSSDGSMAFFSIAADGRALTCDGEVLSRAFGAGSRLRGLAWGSCLTVLWSGDTPVAILTSSKGGEAAWVDWLEPGAARVR